MTRLPKSFIGAALICCISAVGCQSKVYDENVALLKQNRELQAQNRALEQQRDARVDPAQLASMQQTMAQQNQQLAAKDQEIAGLQTQLRQPAPGQPADQSLAGIEVTKDEKAGTLTVNVPGDVLFLSGQADLKDSAKATLNKIASAIKKDYAGKHIIVQGYTDTDPITRTKNKWEDNLELSAARSRAVAKYLESQGIATHEIGMQAYGDTEPKNSKDRSRRVEIVVQTR
jgi:flagellar motor protein MotB